MAEKVVSWKLYYADGSVVTSDDCSWADAPDGVQVLAYDNGYGWTFGQGTDEYRLPGKRKVKHGELMDSAAYELLRKRAYEETV